MKHFEAIKSLHFYYRHKYVFHKKTLAVGILKQVPLSRGSETQIMIVDLVLGKFCVCRSNT